MNMTFPTSPENASNYLKKQGSCKVNLLFAAGR